MTGPSFTPRVTYLRPTTRSAAINDWKQYLLKLFTEVRGLPWEQYDEYAQIAATQLMETMERAFEAASGKTIEPLPEPEEPYGRRKADYKRRKGDR